MLKKWNKFNENWFSKKEEDTNISNTIQPGFKTTVQRPEAEITRLSEEDRKKQIKDFNSKPKEMDYKVDPYFMQEISDRLYGPDSEAYIEAIKEVNKFHRKRAGKNADDFYDNEVTNSVRQRERDINNNIKKREE